MRDDRPRVAFVGLGNMGRPMATLIAAAGYPLAVADSNVAVAAEVARETGAGSRADLRALGLETDVLITMLPTGAIVAEVVGTIAPSMARGAIVIDMSSSAPMGTVALGAELADRGIALVDAPVSGGVRRAVMGDLAIIAGGNKENVERVRPILQTMGTVIPTGPLGSGHALKALNNFVSAAGLTAACEALIIAKQFGLDADTVVEVLNNSTGRNTATESKLRQFVLSETFAAGFSAELMAKDIGTARDLADLLGIAAPMLKESTKLWGEAAESLGRGADHTAIYRYLSTQRSPELS